METTFRPPKRPVGRPKIIKPAPPTATRKGIVAEPNIPDHALELVYDTPVNLKKIFTLFKLMDTRDVKMEFRLSGVRISGAGHLKHNFIDLHIDSAKLTQYFCKHNMIMVIDQKNLEKVIQKIDKSYNSIHFIAKQDSYMKELFVVLNDESQGIKEYHTISLLESSTAVDDNIVGTLPYNSYPLSFTLPSKYFKKVIGDISKFSKDFTVERRAGVLLAFPYDSNSKTIDVNHVFTRPELFKIQSTLKETEFLSTTVRIEYIQSLATALLSDQINVFVDHENMMVFKTTIDDTAFTLLLAVKIVSYK